LMEEVGTYPATRREFRRFLRRRDSVGEAADLQEPAEDLEEWYRFQNAKDLLAAVRKCGAIAQSLPQGWLRVTTPGGAVIRFKQVGKKERARGEGGLKERPVSDKKIMIRACPEAEDPIALGAACGTEQSEALAQGAGPRRPSSRRKEAAQESLVIAQTANARKVNLRVREPTNTGRGSRPRRRGSSACAHHVGNRLWNRRVSAQSHAE